MSYKLKEARISAGLSIDEISKKLNIRKQYLIDLEEENFDSIPGQIYVEGYTKLYYEFLGIERPPVRDASETVKTKYKLKKKCKKQASQKYIVLMSVAILVSIFALYGYIRGSESNVAESNVAESNAAESDIATPDITKYDVAKYGVAKYGGDIKQFATITGITDPAILQLDSDGKGGVKIETNLNKIFDNENYNRRFVEDYRESQQSD